MLRSCQSCSNRHVKIHRYAKGFGVKRRKSSRSAAERLSTSCSRRVGILGRNSSCVCSAAAAEFRERVPQPVAEVLMIHGIEPQVLESDGGGCTATADGIPAMKTLVFLIQGQPWLLLLLASDRVDMRKVAALLRCGTGSVKMASTPGVKQVSGYDVGAVPPFGHPQPLPCLLDVGVSQLDEVVTGSGREGCHLRMRTADLLAASRARLADFARRPASSPLPIGSGRGVPLMEVGLAETWSPGTKAVQLTALVAAKRQMARGLAFLDLVPPSCPLPAPERASVVRRLWKHPESGAAAQLQLIVGKTLEKRLGTDALVQLLKEARVGSLIQVVACPQPRPDGSDSSGTVLDLVCHHLLMLPEGDGSAAQVEGVPTTSIGPEALRGGSAGNGNEAVQQYRTADKGDPSRLSAQIDALENPSRPLYSFPSEKVTWVASLDALREMRQAIFSPVRHQTCTSCTLPVLPIAGRIVQL
eukprot:jgi/Botrbrau1/4685/Bobra.0218s0007.1